MSGKQRNIRKKRTLEEEEPEEAAGVPEVEKTALEDLKLLQKLRKRTAGIHSSALAASRAGDDDDDQPAELMEAYVKEQNQPAVLTEEQHMERFVELEVAKRLGKQVDDQAAAPSKREQDELALYEVPDELKANLKSEVSIPGLHTAITEVDIGKAARLKKIEETEAMKRRLLERDAGWAGEEDTEQPTGPGRVPRGQLPVAFGRRKPKAVPDLAPDELERRRKFVSERTLPLNELAKKQKEREQRRGGGGGDGGGRP